MLSGQIGSGEIISVPRQVGCYIAKKVIGRGGTAIVVKGESTKNGESVALKVMNTKSDGANTHFVNIQQELDIIRRVSHPNIVSAHGIIYEGDLTVIAMEYCQGNLIEWLAKNPPPSQYTLMAAFCQIARAVEYLHENNITHGDIKLDNILIDDQYTPKLTDFGFASTERYKSGEKGGTMIYAAPELFLNGRVDMRAADVWSLGIVLFAMITRKFPYPPVDDERLVRLILQGTLDYGLIRDPWIKLLIRSMTFVRPSKRLDITAVVKEAERITKGLASKKMTQ
jgi:serine/threonine protein kinase